MSNPGTPLQDVKALYFDVFGTTVDWRSTVQQALYKQAQTSLYLSDCGTPMAVREKVEKMTFEDWGVFTQKWREAYYAFTQMVAAQNELPYKTIDEFQLESLNELIQEYQLDNLWSSTTIHDLSRIWHKLDPWDDTVEGIKALNKRFSTCSLSNGNVGLLTDMAEHAGLEWTHVMSAEMFKTYKPNPEVYLGGARKLELQPHECAMVAAHLNDLEAASRQGFRTIYVERPLEEQWDADKIADVKRKGWVDLWVDKNEKGFLAVAERLGIQ